MSFSEVHGQLQVARLDFACSTDLHARLLDIQLSPEQQALLAQIEGPLLRTEVADTFGGQRLRRDLWVREQRRLTRMEQLEQLEALHVVLTLDPADVPCTIKGGCGGATMVPRSVDALLELIRADGPVALCTVLQRLAASGITSDEALTLVASLVGQEAVAPALNPDGTRAARPATSWQTRTGTPCPSRSCTPNCSRPSCRSFARPTCISSRTTSTSRPGSRNSWRRSGASPCASRRETFC